MNVMVEFQYIEVSTKYVYILSVLHKTNNHN